MKTCNKCGLVKEFQEYYKHSKTKDGHHPSCKSCLKEYNRQYYLQNRDKIKRQISENKKKKRPYYNQLNKRERDRLKREVLDAYGGKCACCGEETIEFLTIDHVNDDGSEHRRRLAEERGVKKIRHDMIYREIRRKNFPDDYQVLCMNCNFAKGMFGKCPHSK